jgi:hypothetical protein
LALPVVTGVSPPNGTAGGGDAVNVNGSGFTGANQVMFGGVAGTDVNVVSDSQLTVTSPPPNACGAVDVTVTTAAGTSVSSSQDLFTYAGDGAAPAITAVVPTSGVADGGDNVTVFGTGFTGASQVLFGGEAGTNVNVVSDSQLTVTSPPSNASGAVDVTVTTPAGTSATSAEALFTYVAATAAPVVTSVSPSSGLAGGGDAVTVNGTGFTGASSVLFGSTEAADLTIISDSQLTVTSPAPNVSGAVDVVVYSGEASSTTSPEDLFTYGGPGSGD